MVGNFPWLSRQIHELIFMSVVFALGSIYILACADVHEFHMDLELKYNIEEILCLEYQIILLLANSVLQK